MFSPPNPHYGQSSATSLSGPRAGSHDCCPWEHRYGPCEYRRRHGRHQNRNTTTDVPTNTSVATPPPTARITSASASRATTTLNTQNQNIILRWLSLCFPCLNDTSDDMASQLWDGDGDDRSISSTESPWNIYSQPRRRRSWSTERNQYSSSPLSGYTADNEHSTSPEAWTPTDSDTDSTGVRTPRLGSPFLRGRVRLPSNPGSLDDSLALISCMASSVAFPRRSGPRSPSPPPIPVRQAVLYPDSSRARRRRRVMETGGLMNKRLGCDMTEADIAAIWDELGERRPLLPQTCGSDKDVSALRTMLAARGKNGSSSRRPPTERPSGVFPPPNTPEYFTPASGSSVLFTPSTSGSSTPSSSGSNRPPSRFRRSGAPSPSPSGPPAPSPSPSPPPPPPPTPSSSYFGASILRNPFSRPSTPSRTLSSSSKQSTSSSTVSSRRITTPTKSPTPPPATQTTPVAGVMLKGDIHPNEAKYMLTERLKRNDGDILWGDEEFDTLESLQRKFPGYEQN